MFDLCTMRQFVLSWKIRKNRKMGESNDWAFIESVYASKIVQCEINRFLYFLRQKFVLYLVLIGYLVADFRIFFKIFFLIFFSQIVSLIEGGSQVKFFSIWAPLGLATGLRKFSKKFFFQKKCHFCIFITKLALAPFVLAPISEFANRYHLNFNSLV